VVGSAEETDILLAGATVHFASVSEGIAALRRADPFLDQLSPLDRQARLGSANPVSQDEYLAFVSQQVKPWSGEETATIRRIVTQLRAPLSGTAAPLPQAILLVKTTGREEGQAAYCRGSAIVIPQPYLEFPDSQLRKVLVHELFHVCSSHAPLLRRELYQLIGFHPLAKIVLPQELNERKITNPDAPTLDWYLRLHWNGQQLSAVPILFSAEAYQPGKTLFQLLTFRLLVVTEEAGRWQPVRKDGQLWLLDPSQAADFARQVGRNTNYTIHPEEILADNFVYLVDERQDLPDPWVVEGMRKVLARHAQREGDG
jgi:hypothetical protein